jgi:Spy/CpxP family protein refolding chaperone
MNKPMFIVSLLTFSLMTLSSPFAQEKAPVQDKPHKMWEELGLNEDQKAKLKQMHTDNKDSFKKYGESIKNIRLKIKDELLKPNPSQSVLDNYARQLGDIHTEIAKAHQQKLLKIKGILTTEQFSKLLTMEAKCPKGFGEHCGKGMMGKGCKAQHPDNNNEK